MAVRIAIAGCGGMANGHLRAYLTIYQRVPGKVEPIAMCDPIRENAERFATQVEETTGKRPAVYTDIDEMLDKEDLDGVDICSPHGYHHINAVKCLDAGVNVIVEKPIGVTVKATYKIIEAARRNNRIAATAEQIRRMPSRRASKWAIFEKGLIGEPRQFFSQQAVWVPPREDARWAWRHDLFLGGGGMVMDSGAHFCDTIRWLYGDPDSVYARVEQLERRMVRKGEELVRSAHEDTWIATINFRSGVIGLWSSTSSAPGYSFRHVVHYGSEGALVDSGDIYHGPFEGAKWVLKDGTEIPMSQIVQEYKESLSEEERERLFPHGFEDGVVLECYDFVDAIENGRPPEIPAEEGLRAKAIAEAIYESAAIGAEVSYDAVVSGEIEVYQRPINEHWGL
ncbi:MAG: oxidoreductase [Candidatus Poribacteria bacterium]|nr:MAG: oxidoreductase [Candidatus Poribacteria bacterium]